MPVLWFVAAIVRMALIVGIIAILGFCAAMAMGTVILMALHG